MCISADRRCFRRSGCEGDGVVRLGRVRRARGACAGRARRCLPLMLCTRVCCLNWRWDGRESTVVASAGEGKSFMGGSRRGIEVHFLGGKKGIDPMRFGRRNPHSFSTRRPGSQVSLPIPKQVPSDGKPGLGAGQCTSRPAPTLCQSLGFRQFGSLAALKIGQGPGGGGLVTCLHRASPWEFRFS